MSSETPQYPPYPSSSQPYPQQPQQPQEQGAPTPQAPHPGTTPGYPGYPGYPAYPGYAPAPYYAGPMPRTTNGMAIASLACSIASFIVVPVIGAILGVIFGHIALGQLRRANGTEEGRGLAIAGLAVGYVNLVLWVLGGLIFIIFVLILTSQPAGTSLLW